MAIDLREKSNYFFLIKNGKVYDEHKKNVKILKDYEDSTKYSILFNDKVIVPGGIVWDKVTLDGSPFGSQEEFETWAYENTGFKTASGGSGAGSVNSVTGDGVSGTPEDVVLTFPTLQEVTNEGNETTNAIIASQIFLKELLKPVHLSTARLTGLAGRWTGAISISNQAGKGTIKASDITDNRDYELPDKSGTIALLDDITGGGGVQSVTGDGVDNTDPENPVLSYPTAIDINAVTSDVTSEPSGSDKVVNMVSLTQAEYDAGTPNPQTFYIITDA